MWSPSKSQTYENSFNKDKIHIELKEILPLNTKKEKSNIQTLWSWIERADKIDISRESINIRSNDTARAILFEEDLFGWCLYGRIVEAMVDNYWHSKIVV